MAQRCESDGLALRPHCKTHKSVRVAERQIAHGAIGVCTATVGEAEAPDIRWHYRHLDYPPQW